MPDIAQNIRIVPRYKQMVQIPDEFQKYLWDEQQQTMLEKLVYRVMVYGNFNEIRKIFSLYPEVSLYVAETYRDIHRGVRFWIKHWSNERKALANS